MVFPREPGADVRAGARWVRAPARLIAGYQGSGEAGHVHRGGVGRGRATSGVDDVVDDAHAAEGDGEDVVEVNARAGRRLNRAVGDHRRVDVEEAVHAQPVGRVAGHA